MTPALQRRSLIDELAGKGIRMTAQRRAVIEVIQEAKEHLDAEALLERARERHPNIDRATVYRTIDLLKKLRLIDELDLMHLEGEKHYLRSEDHPRARSPGVLSLRPHRGIFELRCSSS